MTAVPSPVAPPAGESGLLHSHVTMNMPRFHPIAINPNASGPPAPAVQGPYRPYGAPIMEQAPPPGPPATPSQLEQVEARLRQLEHEEASRTAARTHLLAIRKREDDEFRMVTERAEAEEEELRRRRKRLKRESMGITVHSPNDSPPRPTPRRLSETNAATTLAFFKQQSPLEPLPPVTSSQAPSVSSSAAGVGSLRKKQKYTIKNIEAWGERHGRPATYDSAGRALWKRPSDGNLVYLGCPNPGCGKSDFVTLHGFMCHLTKKHKDRSLGNQTRALDICGIIYDPSAPLPQRPGFNRGSTEGSPSVSTHTDLDGCQQDLGYSSVSENDDDQDRSYHVKKEEPGNRTRSIRQETAATTNLPESPPRPNGSIKPTISSMIDENIERPPHESLRVLPANGTTSPSQRNGTLRNGTELAAKPYNDSDRDASRAKESGS